MAVLVLPTHTRFHLGYTARPDLTDVFCRGTLGTICDRGHAFAMDTAIVPPNKWPEAVTERAATAWEESTGENEHLYNRALRNEIHPEPADLQAASLLNDDQHVQLLSSIDTEREVSETRDESEAVGEEAGAGGLLQVAAPGLQLAWGVSDDDEEDEDFLDPAYSPDSDGEDVFRLGQNVVVRLATNTEHTDSGDDSPQSQEAPSTLVSGLLGRIGLRAMLRGGMDRDRR